MKIGLFALQEADRAAVTEHFLRLSREDRRLRFMVSMSDEALKSWCAAMPLSSARGFFHAGKLVAVIQLTPESNNCHEFAISIDEDQRGTGLGRMLLDFAVAATSGATITIHHALENAAMARVYRHCPTRRRMCEGEVDVDIDVERIRDEELVARGLVCGCSDQ